MNIQNIINRKSNNTLVTEDPSAWNYEVEKQTLHLPSGKATEYFGTVRKDTEEILGVVTKQYGIVQNREIFGTGEALFDTLGYGNRWSKYVLTHGGARAHAIYDFRDIGVEVAKNDRLIMRLKVQNSFDGSLGASLTVGLFRLVCSNGLALPINTVSISKKHTLSLDKETFALNAKAAVALFRNSVPAIERMTVTEIGHRGGLVALGNMVRSKVMSERMALEIRKVWERPSYKEDEQRTAWSLYNAVTQHLTHNVSHRRFDLAERVTSSVMNTIIRNPNSDSALYTQGEAIGEGAALV